MKKRLCLFFASFLIFGLLSGCAEAPQQMQESQPTPTQQMQESQPTPTVNAPTTLKRLRILAIGNSFSVDAMEHLYAIAAAEGVEEIVLGNLVIGGCTLQTHIANAQSGEKAYSYRKNTIGIWEQVSKEATFLEGLQDEPWDLITMQQASPVSGIADEYQPYLDQLIAFVQEHKTNPEAKFYWHMTWAYQKDSTHSGFTKYGNRQETMYLGIVNSLQKAVEPTGAFVGILPSGTAIQNARTSHIGDTLTRDGYHLNDLGRVIAAYTWYAALDGQTLYAVNIDSAGSVALTDAYKQVIVKAVNDAISEPYKVTQQSYPEGK